MLRFAPSYIDNPLFRLESRAIRWGQSARQLRRYSLGMGFLVSFIVVAVWLMAVINAKSYYGRYSITSQSSGAISWLFFVSIAVDFFLDMACVGFTLNAVDVTSNRLWWDLLRLTSLSPERIIQAKHAVAQVRAWRVVTLILGMRVGVVVLFAVQLVMFLILSEGQVGMYSLLLVPTLIVFFATYLIEPVWRMQAMTALGIWLSAWTRSMISTGFFGFWLIIVVWIAQLVIIGVVLSVAAGLLFLDVIGVFLVCCVTAWVIFAFYNRLCRWCLRLARFRSFTD